MLTSTHCMLCSKQFGSGVFSLGSDQNNCNRCGKSICDQCSQAKHRLSKLEKKKYRICDVCETILLNYKLDQMWAREVSTKEVRREDMKDAIRDTAKEVKSTAREVKDMEMLL